MWQNSMGLAVDVAVTCPFSKTNLTAEEPAEKYEVRKHTSYDAGFKGTDWRFCALIFETTGGIGEEGQSFLKQLFRFAARQQNQKLCVYAGRAWARLSCNLQTSVAQQILHRVLSGGHVKGDRDALALAEATEELNSAVCSPSTSTFSTAPPNVVAPASPLQSLSPSSSVQTRKESPSGHKHVVEPSVSGSVEPSVSSVPSSHSCSVSPVQAALLRRGLWASSLSPEAASLVPSVSVESVVRPPSPSPAFPPDDVFFRQE